MLARLGPFEALDEDFWIPALALALVQSEPNASPDGFEVDGLVPAVVGDVAEVNEPVEDMLGLVAWLERGWAGALAATEVK